MNENDDIEILDIFDNKKKIEHKEEVILKKKEDNIMKEVPKKKKRRIKTKGIQLIFCSISAIFLFFCLIYYGSRFIKYYRIYNPKVDSDGSVLLGNYIPFMGEESLVYEGNGLYNTDSGNYIYKGEISSNYIKYNNMLWRILSIDSQKNIEIILDDYITLLPWNNEVTNFSKTALYNYLNTDFLNNLNKELLVQSNVFCDSTINSLQDKCTETNTESYVKLLDVKDFLNTVIDKKSYLVKSDEIFWLNNYSEEKVWHTNGVNASMSKVDTFYEIRPVVKLKNTIIYTKGEGTKSNPYIVDDDTIGLGSTILLGEDKWIVYDDSNNLKLMRYELLKDKSIFDKKSYNYDESSIKEYLNTTYLDSLSYKDIIIENEYYVGKYENSISDIKKEKVNVKVSMPNILDVKFDSNIEGYFTLTENDEAMLVYENPLRPSRITTERMIRPCITISKDYANSLKLIDGVFKEEK